MKIHDYGRINAVSSYRKNTVNTDNHTHRANGSAKDEIRISNVAKQLHGANEMRKTRIEELKQALENGTYRVSSQKLAEKIWPFLI